MLIPLYFANTKPGNISPPVPITQFTWVSAEPDTQGAVYFPAQMAGNKTLTGATGVNVVSSGGGTILTITITAGGLLQFRYITPYTDPDTLTISGTDADGLPFSVVKTVNLPF